MKQYFVVEVTDTFSGEANYCWVHRFKVKASTMMGAIRKVGQEMGLSFRKDWDCGDTARYNAKRACICAFVDWLDESQEYGNMKEL